MGANRSVHGVVNEEGQQSQSNCDFLEARRI